MGLCLAEGARGVSSVSATREAAADAVANVMPRLRGRIIPDAPLAEYTWFRVGGPAQFLFSPEDEEDLGVLLANLPADVPVIPLGLCSNVIIRDGGVPGVVIRLGAKGFGAIVKKGEAGLVVGAAVPDARVATTAAKDGIGGLSFYRGIPGAIGGALRMNAGAYGGETKDVLLEARAVDRRGRLRTLAPADLKYAYRHCGLDEDVVFTGAVFQGRHADPKALEAEMASIMAAREASQPIREKTGGSTFKNPPGEKAWQLIDKAGCRGLSFGAAQMSEKHCNFLINTGAATAAEIEGLGEEVRKRVRDKFGIALEWEIKRLGEGLVSSGERGRKSPHAPGA
jgi:UDP-N-acetylmuramate dehydrogenase